MVPTSCFRVCDSSLVGLFRTHIGSSTNEVNAQVYDSPESMAHFAKFARIFAQLADYRLLLMKEAQEKGYPLVRCSD